MSANTLTISGKTVIGTPGRDTIVGTQLADHLFGAGGDDMLSGLGGNDWLGGGPGNDQLDGGDGIDTASYADASAGVTVNLLTGRADGGAGSDILLHIENVTGSNFGDSVVGNAGGNTLDGGPGNDLLYGGGGSDLLLGGDGRDKLSGGDGSDALSGGPGNDYLYGNAGNDWLEGDAGSDVLTGGDGSDRIEGGDGIDTANYADVASAAGVTVSLDNFAGTARTFDALGNPATDALSGIENVIGSNFGDRLYGGAGMNFIKGGYGDDVIAGGGGDDTLAGGAGRDVFYFPYGEFGGADTILDWDATNDLVELGTLGAPVVRNAGVQRPDSDHNGLVNDADVGPQRLRRGCSCPLYPPHAHLLWRAISVG